MRKAVIDMGTNSTRLAVAEWSDHGLQMIETKVAETRLGEGLGSDRRIKPIPLARNVEAVEQFVKRAGELGAAEIRITATSAVRDAVNKEEIKTSPAYQLLQQKLPMMINYADSLLSVSTNSQHINIKW